LIFIKYIFTVANQENASKVLDFYRSLIGTLGCTWDLTYPNKEIVEQDINSKSLYLLKESDEIISVAFAGVSDELNELKWFSENPCDLARIGVLSSRQNQGIGSIMLNKVANAVKERGFDGIRMLVSRNNISALALYDKNGFSKYGFSKYGETNMYGIDFYCYEMGFNNVIKNTY
jgi:ribosomal protein S18 acetylase RimI-like enzyme